MSAGQPPPPPPPADRSGAGAALWLAGAGLLALYVGCELYLVGHLGYPLDDSWIHLQFARQLSLGEGLSYNPGEWSTGSTAPLWTAILSLVFALPGSAVAWSKLLGGFFYLVSADATARLAGELGLGRVWRRLAAGLVLATPWLVWSALSGMEVPLFTALSLWGLVLHLRERRRDRALPLGLAVLALACLARPEGYALFALALLDRLTRFERGEAGLRLARPELRGVAEGLLLAAIVLAPTLVFYRLAGGSLLPSTFAAKAAAPVDLVPSGPYLRAVIDILFRSQPLMLLAAGAGVSALVERLGSERDRGLLVALWPLGLALAYSLIAPEAGHLPVGNFGRYYFPLLPVVVVLGTLGLEAGAARFGARSRALAFALVALLFLPQLWGLADGCGRYARTIANVEDSDVAAARWLAERVPAEALLAVQDVGALKYLLPNRVLDLAGIVTPEILPALRGTALGTETGGESAADEVYWEARVVRFLAERRPDYLVIFPKTFPWLARPAPGFERVASFRVDENLAMIGDQLVILATPWTDDRPPAPEQSAGDAP